MSISNSRTANYHSYMVRLWRESGAEEWRAAAQSTTTARVYQFANIEALFDFLRGETQLTDGDGAPDTAAPDSGQYTPDQPDGPAGD